MAIKKQAFITPKLLQNLNLYYKRVIKFHGNPIRTIPKIEIED